MQIQDPRLQDRYLDAVTAVLDWDIPEHGYSEAVNAQACHLAGSEAADDWGYDVDITVH